MSYQLSSISYKRKRLNLTQQVLAKKAGISQSLLTKIERGVVVPNYNIAMRLFEALEELEHSDEKTLSDIMHLGVITVKISDTVEDAARIVKKHAISQLPVMDGAVITGVVTTSMLVGVQGSVRISSIMKEPYPILSIKTPVDTARALLKQYPAILVIDKSSLVGIVTAEDML